MTAGKLVRKQVRRARWKTNEIEQFQHAATDLSGVTVSLVVNGSAMMALMRMRGLSEANGSWNTA